MLVLAAASGGAAEVHSRTRFLMGTTCTIEADLTPGRLDVAFEEVDRVEGLLSTWTDDSELSRLNHAAGRRSATVSPELFNLLEAAIDWSVRTNGSFNPLVGPLLDLWNVRGSGASPSEEQIDKALSRIKVENVELIRSGEAVRINPDTEFEEGGFGKGYALDLAIEKLVESGCTDCLIDFGGQLAVRSARPRTIHVASPVSRDQAVLSLDVRCGSVATTSGSEKWFETPEGPLSHIIDPRTGRAVPPRGSTTVVHQSALVADILATALYVMGPEEGLEWADENRVAAVFIVPSESGWSVVASKSATKPGLGLKSVSADFHLKGKN